MKKIFKKMKNKYGRKISLMILIISTTMFIFDFILILMGKMNFYDDNSVFSSIGYIWAAIVAVIGFRFIFTEIREIKKFF